jgi:hypothetical protein
MSTYTFGGFAAERDATCAHIRALQSEGRLPNDFYYVFDSFKLGDQRVEISEFPVLTGHEQNSNRFTSPSKPCPLLTSVSRRDSSKMPEQGC